MSNKASFILKFAKQYIKIMENIDIEKLITKIKKLAKKPFLKKSIQTSFTNSLFFREDLKFEKNSPRHIELENKISLLNESLRGADLEEHLVLTKQLMSLWWDVTHSHNGESVFGELISVRGFRRSILTLSADGSQLRVWYGFFGKIEKSHIDSCGRNLVASIYGEPEMVAEYLRELMDIHRLESFSHWSGAQVFMGYFDWKH